MAVDVAPADLPPGVEDLPLDDPPAEPDRGDPGHPGHDEQEAPRGLTAALSQPRSARVILLPCPYPGATQKGSHGLHVIAIKRAVSAAGLRPWSMPNTTTFGATLALEVKSFQHAHGIQATGKYGPPTHRALTPFFDAYGRSLLARYLAAQRPDPKVAIQHAVVAVAMFTLANAHAIGYSMGSRRMEGVTRRLHPPELPGVADCSSLATWDYYVPGNAPDPNGFRFNGQGFTGSIADHCRVVPAPGPPGALYLYGSRYPWEHVAVGLGDGTVISHGTAVTLHLPGHYRPDLGRIVMPPELL